MPIDTILFDAEGVIVDTEKVWDHGSTELLRRRGKVYDSKRTKPLLTGRSLPEGVRVMQEHYGFDGDPEVLARERLEIVRALFAEVAFMPGFLGFHARVRGRFKIAVATAMHDELLAPLDLRLGLTRLFDGHVYHLAHVGGRSKPNPDIFLYAAERLGSPPESCLVLEDAPYGIEAARRAGMACIGLATTYPPEMLTAADRVVRTFDEIDLEDLGSQPAGATAR
jgi:HAD superfamily hydrolase (TIGR01509 family)